MRSPEKHQWWQNARSVILNLWLMTLLEGSNDPFLSVRPAWALKVHSYPHSPCVPQLHVIVTGAKTQVGGAALSLGTGCQTTNTSHSISGRCPTPLARGLLE